MLEQSNRPSKLPSARRGYVPLPVSLRGPRRLLLGICLAVCLPAALAGSKMLQKPDSAAAAKRRPALITRAEITSVESPTFEGRIFGKAGQYEKLVGRFTGELDPSDPFNAFIVNIDRAPRNAQG